MKRQFLFIALFVFPLFLLESAHAQTGSQLFTPQKLQSKLSKDLARLSRQIVPDSVLKLQKTRLISPTVSWRVKNKGQINTPRFIQHPPRRINRRAYFYPGRKLPASIKQDPNAGSVDPGIFYAPAEKVKPAMIIIKPLKDVDPKMVVKPGSLKRPR